MDIDQLITGVANYGFPIFLSWYAEQLAEQKAMAQGDKLTGLYNRLAYEDAIN